MTAKGAADSWSAQHSGAEAETLPEGVKILLASLAGPIARPQSPGRYITVALIPVAGDDLRHLQGWTGLSRTDLVNRAITLYAFVDTQLKAGRDLLVRDNATRETELVRLI